MIMIQGGGGRGERMGGSIVDCITEYSCVCVCVCVCVSAICTYIHVPCYMYVRVVAIAVHTLVYYSFVYTRCLLV